MKHLVKLSLLTSALCLLASGLLAQTLTPVPAVFSDWTGTVSNNFFDPNNWSTGIVPNSGTSAIRLPGDPAIPNKNINAFYTGTMGDMTLQFFSAQTGANKVYTTEFSGNVVTDTGAVVTGSAILNVSSTNIVQNNWLIINPVGKGFTFNGVLGSNDAVGLSQDITYPPANGDSTTRMTAY